MSNRSDKIIRRVDEYLTVSMEKRAAMLKRAGSILDETGGVVGGVGGTVAGLNLSRVTPNKYKALASLLGGVGGGVVGLMGGSAIGQSIADKRRLKNYQELLQAAEVNRRKALMDSTAMRALGTNYQVPV